MSVCMSVCLSVCDVESWVSYMNFQSQSLLHCHHVSVSLGRKVRLTAVHMCVFTLPCLMAPYLHHHYHVYIYNTY